MNQLTSQAETVFAWSSNIQSCVILMEDYAFSTDTFHQVFAGLSGSIIQ